MYVDCWAPGLLELLHFPCPPTTPGSDDSKNQSAIIGGAVGGICLLLLIDTILCLVWLKRQSDGEDDYILKLLMLLSGV